MMQYHFKSVSVISAGMCISFKNIGNLGQNGYIYSKDCNNVFFQYAYVHTVEYNISISLDFFVHI